MKAVDYSLLIFLTTTGSVYAAQRITEGPSDTIVRPGGTARLTCRVENQKGELQWSKNEFGLGSDRDLKYYARYRMVGSVRHGEYHLLIVDASVTDEGSYQCHLAATDDEKMHHSSEIAHLTVSEQPTPRELVAAALVIGSVVFVVLMATGFVIRQRKLARRTERPLSEGSAHFDSSGLEDAALLDTSKTVHVNDWIAAATLDPN
ncbi:Protein SYG-1 a [Aphelenchoides avenae]|nr:Protein SYG-1 a [Aphelenchus avenae]